MRKLAQRAVIAGASVLAITSAVAGADLLGQARADDTHCVANATDPCPPQADTPQISTVCMGGGPKTGGDHCFQEMVP